MAKSSAGKTPARRSPRQSKPAKSRIATRKDVQYLVAFLAGAVVPFAGGAAASLASSALWMALVPPPATYSPYINALVNGVTYATLTIVMMIGMAGLIWAFRSLGTRVKFRGSTLGVLAVGAVTFGSAMLQFRIYTALPNLNPNLYVYLDLASMTFFGLAYVLGWWVAQRYAKLG